MSLNKILRVFLLLILVGTFSQVQAYPGSTPAGEPDGGIIGNWAEDLRAIMAPNSITTPTSIGVGAAILSTDGDGLKTATVSADLTFDVEGKIGATHYCDKDGLQCFTAAQFAALAGGGGADGIGGDAALSVSGANLQLTDTVNTTTVPLSSIVTQSLVNGHVSTYLTSNNYVNTAAACDDAEILQYDTTNGWECVAVGSVTSDTDDQTLSLTGTTLAISEGNNVSLASFLDNTDAQDLSLVGDVLTLSGDPNAGVDLDAYLTTNNYVDESYLTTNNYITTAEVNDLAETVAITAGTCSGKVVQSNGTTWSCVTPGSGADGISATAALSINGSNLQLTDGTNTTSIALNLIDTDTDTQDLSLAGTVISLVDGGSVDLAGVVGVGTDAQDLSLSGSTLSLTGDGTTVSLASFLDNTDAQDLSLVGDVLTLSGDPNAGVDLDAY
ncbi:MAG TPA: hypothetical protein VIT68_00670, partial [Candidatus Gracilibacteria bacterium]